MAYNLTFKATNKTIRFSSLDDVKKYITKANIIQKYYYFKTDVKTTNIIAIDKQDLKTLEELFTNVKNDKHCLYEVLYGQEVYPLYFDIEYYNDKKYYDILSLLLIKLKSILDTNYIFYTATENNRITNSNTYKSSYHMISTDLLFKSKQAIKKFITTYFTDNEIKKYGIDLSVYSEFQLFRCVHSLKDINDSNTRFKPIKNDDIRCNLVSYFSKNVNNLCDSYFRYDTTDDICKIPDEVKYNFELDIDIDLKHLQEALFKLPKQYYTEFMLWRNIIWASLSYSKSKEMIEILRAWSKQEANKFNEKSFMNIVKNFKVKENGITFGSLIYILNENNIELNFKIRKQNNNKLIKKHDEIYQKLLQDMNIIKGDSKYLNDMIQIDYDTKYEVFKSQTGTGKTYAAVEYFNNLNDNYKRCLVIAPSRSLCRDLAKRFNFTCYIDDNNKFKRDMIHENKLVVCVNSLDKVNTLDNYYDAIFVDEASEVMKELFTGGLLNNKRRLIFSIFKRIIKQSKKCIFGCADLTMPALINIKTICNDAKIKLYLNQFKSMNNIIVNKSLLMSGKDYHIYEMNEKKKTIFYEKMDASINRNEKVFYFSNLKSNCEINFKRLMEKFKSKCILLLTGDEKVFYYNNKQNKLNNYTIDDINNADIIIISPCITFGVDFNLEARVFCEYNEQTIKALTMCQQMNRVRKPLNIEFLFHAFDKKKHILNSKMIYKGFMLLNSSMSKNYDKGDLCDGEKEYYQLKSEQEHFNSLEYRLGITLIEKILKDRGCIINGVVDWNVSDDKRRCLKNEICKIKGEIMMDKTYFRDYDLNDEQEDRFNERLNEHGIYNSIDDIRNKYERNASKYKILKGYVNDLDNQMYEIKGIHMNEDGEYELEYGDEIKGKPSNLDAIDGAIGKLEEKLLSINRWYDLYNNQKSWLNLKGFSMWKYYDDEDIQISIQRDIDNEVKALEDINKHNASLVKMMRWLEKPLKINADNFEERVEELKKNNKTKKGDNVKIHHKKQLDEDKLIQLFNVSKKFKKDFKHEQDTYLNIYVKLVKRLINRGGEGVLGFLESEQIGRTRNRVYKFCNMDVFNEGINKKIDFNEIDNLK